MDYVQRSAAGEAALAAAYSALQSVLTLVARQQCVLEDRTVLLRNVIPPHFKTSLNLSPLACVF